MTIAVGPSKQFRYKVESSWGTAPGTTGGQLLRRVTSDINLVKDTYQSNEVRSDRQVADFRHGARRVEGSISGELSAGTYADFVAAAVRQAYGAVSSITSLTLDVSGSGPTYTVTRASGGSWLTDGVKVGMVIRLAGANLEANNISKNLFVTAVTALNLTVIPGGDGTMTAEVGAASSTVSFPGKVTYAPTSSHTDKSFYIEQWFSDISISHQYSGCKINTMDLNLPATGMATVGFGVLGKDRTRDTSAYFSSPTAETGTGIAAAVNGALIVNGSAVGVLTGLSVSLTNNRSVAQVVGSNTTPDVFSGTINVSGQFTALFEDDTYQAMFDNESEVSLALVMYENNDDDAEFISITLPRIKVGGAGINDQQSGLIQTLPFTALLDTTGGASADSYKTTIMVCDSAA